MKLWRYGQSVEYLGHRYRLDGMLGSGGMADVCLAWDEREQREVALKILKSDDLDQETLNRFMKEAAQIASWQHPHILRVYESLQVELIDAANGSVLFYMVSEYARGGDLQKRLTPGRPFPLSASFTLFRQLCDAVQYAHERGVIHRDLKPLNMLFRRTESGPEEVVLSDFGLAVQVDASHHTFAHGGTLAYMAPEQFQGNALPASDIFALGVILYLLCTGNLPFRRTLQDMAKLAQGMAPTPVRPGLLNPELPPALDEVMLRAMHELPAERYRQPREFWEAIEQVLTASAQTFPFVEDFWQNAGQTWPYDGSEQPQRSRQADQQRQSSTASASRPGETAPEVEEGLVSALWIAREKQKASPVRLPLPTNSIPMLPNPADDDALPAPPRAAAAPATWQADDDQGRVAAERAATVREDEQRPARPANSRAQAPLASPSAARKAASHAHAQPGNAGSLGRPSASASGSTILPGPLTSPRDEEQTSRRQPFVAPHGPCAEPDYQTSRHHPTGQLPAEQDRQGYPRQPFASGEMSGAFPFAAAEQPGRRASRQQPAPLDRQSQRLPGRENEKVRPRSRRRVSEYDSSGAFADGAYTVPRSSAGSDARRRVPIQRASAADRATALPRPARGRAHPTSTSAHGRTAARRRIPLIAILSGLVLLGLLLAIFAATNFQGTLLTFFGAPITTVTLQPRAQLVQTAATLSLRTDGGPPAPGEVPGRQLTATSPTQSTTANATGSTQAKRATGELTFINDTANTITINGGTVTGNSGVEISFNGPIIIPALNPTFVNVPANAVNAGVAGNIPAFDIDKACCMAGVVVKNAAAFTGGQDAQKNSVLQQKDIDGAANGLVASAQEQAQGDLRAQVRANERVAGSAQCQPQITSDHQAGALTKQATVQVAVTCSATVYDYNAAVQSLTRDLQQKASADPALGSAYALEGSVALTQVAPSAGSTLTFHAQGTWVYQFKPATLRNLALLIAGKSQDNARVLLLHQPGVAGVQFSRSGSLPVNTSEIQINVQAPQT